MDIEFRNKTKTRRLVGLGFVLISLIYLAWRLTIFNPYAMGVSAAFYAAEVIGVVLAITTVLLTWTYRVDPAPQAPAGLSVDVLVLCYSEPVEIIQRTLEAAANLDYPHTTWLLDDGRRPEMKALAERLSCRYLARDTNLNAKAGNINHALTHAQGEFVVVFDGDHVPLPEALDRLLGYFADPKVAMVQAPQDYYNTDSIQYFNRGRRGALWHDQSHFYHFSQPCRFTWNAVTCCGTSVAYRRSALN
ncbi:MAG: glycosyltransferase, partial [Rhizobiales bacterium]|nr:glycosyltransferase [Hyphomicrobiales bacterium]